jgi:ferritin-like metal-binding protein YciE
MPTTDSSISNLHQLLKLDICRQASAEVQLQRVLPEWAIQASSLKLKAFIQKYLDFVIQQKQELDQFIEQENINQLPLCNRVMQAFIHETEEKTGLCSDAEVKDACLLSSIQEINHYKISAYGTAAAFASTLGMDATAQVFRKAEVNEKQIDDRLSQLAAFEINLKARAPIVLPG